MTSPSSTMTCMPGNSSPHQRCAARTHERLTAAAHEPMSSRGLSIKCASKCAPSQQAARPWQCAEEEEEQAHMQLAVLQLLHL